MMSRAEGIVIRNLAARSYGFRVDAMVAELLADVPATDLCGLYQVALLDAQAGRSERTRRLGVYSNRGDGRHALIELYLDPFWGRCLQRWTGPQGTFSAGSGWRKRCTTRLECTGNGWWAARASSARRCTAGICCSGSSTRGSCCCIFRGEFSGAGRRNNGAVECHTLNVGPDWEAGDERAD
jgi:hypothetical protein